MTLPSAAFKEVKDEISAALVKVTRTVGQLANEDLAFQRSSDPAIVPLLDKQSSRLLDLAQKLIRSASADADLPAPRLTSVETIDDNWRGLVDVFDSLLEKADASLDEYSGVIKKLDTSLDDQTRSSDPSPGRQNLANKYKNSTLPKPQLEFQVQPSNHETTPFKPLLTSKPHSLQPLEQSLKPTITTLQSEYAHPYETEIKQARVPSSIYVASEPIMYLPFESTQATFVDTMEGVHLMLKELQNAQEIAIDLEHHDEHSYLGIVSLMQISTRHQDWIVDTLKPWRRQLQILNEVFADPNIVKVFHGSSMDMIWLQRDLGLYVVSLFDTYHASWALGYPKHSLAFLLKKFVDFDAAKQYQQADWRIRPLPEQMFDYARSDTHFLLYIYDMIRIELIQKSAAAQKQEIEESDLVKYVMDKSKEESLQTYQFPFYDEEHGVGPMGWYNMLYRTPAIFDKEQFAVFRAVHQWRDGIARDEDESVHTIMSKRSLFNIARAMPLDIGSLLGCSHPISPQFRERKKEVLDIIRRAKAAGSTGPNMYEVFSTIPASITAPESSSSYATVGTTLTTARDAEIRQAQLTISSFWGPASTGSELKSSRKRDNWRSGPDLHLAIPLPAMNVYPEDVDTGDSDGAAEAVDTAAISEQPKAMEIFTVRDKSRAQKRKLVDEGMQADISAADNRDDMRNGKDPETANPNGADGDVATDGAEKIRLKEETKAARKRQRREKAQQEEEAKLKDRPEILNYQQAESVLHAKRSTLDPHGKAAKAANPYAKSLDAPKAMSRVQRETAGKSFTFKK